MTTLMRERVVAAAKIGMLLVTATLLMATSRPLDCDHPAAPVVFRATGTCGPGGLVVVETQAAFSTVSLANAAALGLPPLDRAQGNSGRYLGKSCPFTVDKGGWQFEWTCGASGDGAGGNGGGGGQAGGALAGPDESEDATRLSTGGGGYASSVDAGLVAAADGGAAGGGAGGVGGVGGRGGGSSGGVGGLTMSCLRICAAHLGINGELLFTCSGARGEMLCESRLTKVVLP